MLVINGLSCQTVSVTRSWGHSLKGDVDLTLLHVQCSLCLPELSVKKRNLVHFRRNSGSLCWTQRKRPFEMGEDT